MVEIAADASRVEADAVIAAAEDRVELVGAAGNERVATVRCDDDATRVVNRQLRIARSGELVEVERNNRLSARRRIGRHDAAGVGARIGEDHALPSGRGRDAVGAACAGDDLGGRRCALGKHLGKIDIDQITRQRAPRMRAVRIGMFVRCRHVEVQAVGRYGQITEA